MIRLVSREMEQVSEGQEIWKASQNGQENDGRTVKRRGEGSTIDWEKEAVCQYIKPNGDNLTRQCKLNVELLYQRNIEEFYNICQVLQGITEKGKSVGINNVYHSFW